MNINLTLIGQMVAFVCVVMFCMKYVWPPILAAMAEREKKMADGLAAADRAGHDLALAKQKAVERLIEAKHEAAAIVDSANKRGIQIVEEAKTEARTEGQRLIDSAKSEIDQEINRAKEALRSQVAGLVITGAEKVLQDNIDAAKHGEMLDKLAAEL